jgi:hypothetical protein
MRLPIDRFLNLLYFWATENAEDKDRRKFDTKLNLPDSRPGKRLRQAARPDSPWSKDNEERSLALFAAQLKGDAAVPGA